MRDAGVLYQLVLRFISLLECGVETAMGVGFAGFGVLREPRPESDPGLVSMFDQEANSPRGWIGWETRQDGDWIPPTPNHSSQTAVNSSKASVCPHI
jgi:hypothetical protein